MDRILVAGALLLLILEISFLVSDLDGASSGRLFSAQEKNLTATIGEMSRAENLVRRRSRDSLIWDESASNDHVFEYDSVLTLTGSSAQVRLLNDTTLNLDENTLIVLEPSQAQTNGSIRVRFSRGNMRTQNPGSPLAIEANGASSDKDSFVLETEKGSIVSLVSLEDGRFGVEVEEGQAHLKSDHGLEKITKGERAVIQERAIKKRDKLSSDLKWSRELPKRLYARAFPLSFDLKWAGPANTIEMIDPRRVSHEISISENTFEKRIDLSEGSYLFRLKNQNGISSSFQLQLRQAPDLSYLSPLPRDRAVIGSPLLFAWEAAPGAKGYRIEISPQDDFSSGVQILKSGTAQMQTSIQGKGKYHWRVVGIDADGWEIPSPYSFPLFMISKPLQAPKLHEPVIRAPAASEEPPAPHPTPIETPAPPEKGAAYELRELRTWPWAFALEKWIFKNAHASEETKASANLEALFSWAEVENANYYVIEIAKKPTFNDLVITERVSEPSYTWKGFKPGVYFWRVAAGRLPENEGDEDRLGLFSAPALVRLDPSLFNPAEGVRVQERTAAPPTPEPSLEAAVELPTADPVSPPLPTPPPLEALLHVKKKKTDLEKKEDTPASAPNIDPTPRPLAPSESENLAAAPSAPTTSSESVVELAVEPAPAPQEQKKKSAPPRAPKKGKYSARFWYTPRYRSMSSKNERDIEAALTGFVPLGFEANAVIPGRARLDFEWLAQFSEANWVPRGSQEFQGGLKDMRYGLDALFRNRGSAWSLGIGAERISTVSRVQAETAELKFPWVYGPTTRVYWQTDSSEAEARLSARFGDGLVGGRLSTHWALHLNKTRMPIIAIGPAFGLTYFTGSDSRTLFELEIGLLLGIGF